jgi:phage terminase small subunit
VPKTNGLSNKQKMFCLEYLKDFNATKAAIRSGYKARSAGAIGYENLQKPEIMEEIKRLVEERQMKSDEVILRLSEIARGDIGEFIEIEDENIRIDLDKAKKLGMTKLIKKVKEHKNIIITDNLKKGTTTEKQEYFTEVELYSAVDALEMIGKYHKMFTERHEVTGKDGVPLVNLGEVQQSLEKIYGDRFAGSNATNSQ